jgi:uncharacterized protein (DUF1697 family)
VSLYFQGAACLLPNCQLLLDQPAQNDWRAGQPYDVLDLDTEDIINELPIRKEFLDVRYTPGALIGHVNREHYNKSQLNKIIGHMLYQSMTIRNIKTARYLAGLCSV